jgi:glycosyltransferase involved in cell wall biosynthesis
VSATLTTAPSLVSVVMPVLDGEAHVGDQLAALAAQTYTGEWELIVVDNGCRDRTLEIVRGCAPQLPSVTIADATAQRGLNRARNAGVRAARGDLLAFCDSDDVVSEGWLAAMVEAARGADLVGGRLDTVRLNDAAIRAWRPKGPITALVRGHDFMAYAPGGNLAVWTRVAREIGWDERFEFGSSDHGFAWQAQMAGHTLAYAHDAVIHQRFRPTMRAMARQFYRYGASEPLLYRAFRDRGMPAPDNGAALRRWGLLARTVPDLWRSSDARGTWVRRAAFRLGHIEGCIRARVLWL